MHKSARNKKPKAAGRQSADSGQASFGLDELEDAAEYFDDGQSGDDGDEDSEIQFDMESQLEYTPTRQSPVSQGQNERPVEKGRASTVATNEMADADRLNAYLARLKSEKEEKEEQIKQLNSQLARVELQPKIEILEMKLQNAKTLFERLLDQISLDGRSPVGKKRIARNFGESSAEGFEEPVTPASTSGSVDANLAEADQTVDTLKLQLKQAIARMEQDDPSDKLVSDAEVKRLENRVHSAHQAIRNVRRQIYEMLGLELDPGDLTPEPEFLPAPTPKGIDRNLQDNFVNACRSGSMQTARHLLGNEQVKVDYPGKDGCTALCAAAEKGHLGIVRMLVSEYKADVEKRDTESFWTPLMFAAFMGKFEVVQYLLLSGASVNNKNRKGNTALALASEAPYHLVSKEDKETTYNLIKRNGGVILRQLRYA